MTVLPRLSLCVTAALLLADCAHRSTPPPEPSHALPAPDPGFKVKRYSSVVGWPEGKRPLAPEGFEVTRFASGLRNPVGMGWAPGTRVLWTVVNERDDLGEDLVPDYLTHVEDGGFYGWPFAYFGANEDPRLAGQRPDLVKQTLVPDVALGAHTASLGLAFYEAQAFPKRFQGGAFIGQHGSWNRSELSGYKVVFVPFANGRPSGPPEDFLTGFIADAAQAQVYGRPVGITLLPDGALLVADDASNTLWKVSAKP
ncbi:PQQ-dependent sugar dehydrogenase [Corallococcus sicarius]|uniref:Pyrroloquinoline quinone-dependent pyranose dehydrogenase beta-propeller domain-containing protein n=1 Tax=Corallococcus sicarius TaxID=2316726 RepID=A0A3A8NNN1_9BACT|nr:PQQ-dependent sugar dehydrogenase [Corallococcus sicarius]RKH45818.1 hypothetical protein D7X12_06975 [Corallococcus sicarius]